MLPSIPYSQAQADDALQESSPSSASRQYKENPSRPQLKPWQPPKNDQDDKDDDDDPQKNDGQANSPVFQTEPQFTPVDLRIRYAHPNAPFVLARHNLYLAPVTIRPPSMQIWDFNSRKGEFELLWLNDEAGLGSGAFNLQRVEYRGKPHLLAWSGHFNRWPGYGTGYCLLLDESYKIVLNVTLPDPIDFHDLTLTADDTLISTVYRQLGPFDHSRLGGSAEDGAIFDSAFVEYSFETGRTGKPIFGWSPYEAGISFDMSRIKPKPNYTSKKPWDWAHTNSVYKDQLGNYLVSLRSLATLFYIDGQTKETLWQLGGPNSNFTGNGSSEFSWQHNALWLEEEEKHGVWSLDEIKAASQGVNTPNASQQKKNRKISLYDNAALSKTKHDRNESRGLIIELDMSAKTAHIVQVYEDPGRQVPGFKKILSTSQGNLQILPPFPPWDGRHNDAAGRLSSANSSSTSRYGRVGQTPVLLAYGVKPFLALYERSGVPLWLAEYKLPKQKSHQVGNKNVDSYRTYLGRRWRGQPHWPPRIKLSADMGQANISNVANFTRVAWISWNGAAGVAEYRITHGIRTRSRVVIPREGFETTTELGTRIKGSRLIQMEVFDSCGHMLAKSPPLAVTALEGLLLPSTATDKWEYGWNQATYRCPLPE
ncbi:unnamed protein product [Tilletia laevis]|nr:hypothetical protein CF336_g3529 [Tilletia laevis]KAE8202621.1 hypothetical protein CF328_g2114 [Tilletia controversa]CAD6888772.1 unnamed protein product [Tilletia caries]KAE8204554.1 hypothetical protein CF335_g2611 [Tilletia laevis]CAD6902141.1 unnamed protein product [Tilletia caries]